jgi:hypothetical protein
VDLSIIPPFVWSGLTGSGFLALLFTGLYKGWIVVGKIHDEQIADKDSQITRLWASNESLIESVRKYAVSAETSAHALHEVERRAAKAGGE